MNADRTELAARIRRELGMGIEALPAATLDMAISAALRRRNLRDPSHGVQEIPISLALLEELTESVVVPETWFFRDGEPFRLLADWARNRNPPPNETSPLRLLSIPCSTGEEPYSAAMALLQAGLMPGQFTIDAVDISRQAIERARVGAYGGRSFRESGHEKYQSFFTQDDRVWILDETVRSLVRFHHAHAVDFAERHAPEALYHVVLCRNLLIYLDDPHRRRLLAALNRRLAPGGLFILGHAEMPHVFLPHYRPAARARSFAAHKPMTAPPPEPPPPVPSVPPSRRPATVRAGITAREMENRLARIERRMTTRDWNTAETECRDLLDLDITCAQGWFWLGVLSLERRRAEEAIEHLNRALYLEPYYTDALRRMSDARRLAGRDGQALHYRKLADACVPAAAERSS